MADIQALVTDNLDIWVAAVKTQSTSGRGSRKKLELTGVKKLRELILELAVRGKLVPQDPNDEPASVLLEKIAAEKNRLIKDKKIKKPKKLSEICEDEKLFVLPIGWSWGYLSDLTRYIQRGKGPKYEEYGQVRVISQKCIQWSGFDINPARYVDDDSLSKYQRERFLQSNDLLWNSTGTGTVGRINIIDNIKEMSMVADSHVTVIRPLIINSQFLWCYIAAPGIQGRINPDHETSLVSGTTKQVELNTSVVNELLIPVAPLSEQHRIVAKVDELMALCDQLEQQTEASITAHKTLVDTLLDALVNPEQDATVFADSWTLIEQHFNLLFTTEQSIDKLKQTILQLAVMGKLIPQNSNDEPASVLLEKIAVEKELLIKEKKIKKPKAMLTLEELVLPFSVSSNWQWCRLGELCHTIADGPHFSPKYVDSSEGVTFLSTRNISVDTIDLTTAKYVSRKDHDIFCKRVKVKKGDILYTKGGTTGIAKVNNLELEFSVWVHLAVLQIPNKMVFNEYVAMALNSPHCYQQSQKYTNGIGNKDLGLTRMINITIPFPPLNEQHRIVAKVDELMTLCDNLKSQLINKKTTQQNLATAFVEKTLTTES